MPRVRTIQNNFTTGEISPRLSARVDFAKYGNAVETLENFLPLPHGGIKRRPGTRYVAEAKDSSKIVRLVSFEFNVEQAYIIEVGSFYMRFYTQSGRLEVSSVPVEIRTPYEVSDIFDLQFAQSADVLYIAHKEHPPHKLERTSATVFTLTEISFVDGPYKAEVTGAPTITTSAATGSITLTASAALFNFSTDTFGSNPFATVNGSKVITVTDTGHGLKSGEKIEFAGSPIVNGIPAGEINVWHTAHVIDANTYEVDAATTPATSTGTGGGAGITWIHSKHYGALIRIKDTAVYGYVRITDVTSTTIATATVEEDLDGFGVAVAYRMGEWTYIDGFPRTVAFFEERLYWAGSNNKPQTFWGSVEADFENHRPGTNDADAVAFTIGSDQVNVIRWIMPGSALMIGTAGGEFVVRGGASLPISPVNVLVKSESSHGSGKVRPIRVSSVLLFLQRAGKKLRQLIFSLDEDAFVAPDLSILAEHITSPGIVDMAYEEEPYSTIWLVRSDGILLSLTYLKEHEVVAWARHITGVTSGTQDAFESVATIPHPNGDRDQTWVLVNRTVGGAVKRYIEFFDTVGGYYDDLGVDSGLIYSGAPTTTLTGLTHLEGAKVAILGDGAEKTEKVVASGQVTVDDAVADAEVGLPFASKVVTLRPEVQLDMTIQGLPIADSTLVVRIYKSEDIEVEGDMTALREVGDRMDTAVPLFTGDLNIGRLGIDTKGKLTIRQPGPVPCTLLAIVRSLQIGDN